MWFGSFLIVFSIVQSHCTSCTSTENDENINIISNGTKLQCRLNFETSAKIGDSFFPMFREQYTKIVGMVEISTIVDKNEAENVDDDVYFSVLSSKIMYLSLNPPKYPSKNSILFQNIRNSLDVKLEDCMLMVKTNNTIVNGTRFLFQALQNGKKRFYYTPPVLVLEIPEFRCRDEFIVMDDEHDTEITCFFTSTLCHLFDAVLDFYYRNYSILYGENSRRVDMVSVAVRIKNPKNWPGSQITFLARYFGRTFAKSVSVVYNNRKPPDLIVDNIPGRQSLKFTCDDHGIKIVLFECKHRLKSSNKQTKTLYRFSNKFETPDFYNKSDLSHSKGFRPNPIRSMILIKAFEGLWHCEATKMDTIFKSNKVYISINKEGPCGLIMKGSGTFGMHLIVVQDSSFKSHIRCISKEIFRRLTYQLQIHGSSRVYYSATGDFFLSYLGSGNSGLWTCRVIDLNGDSANVTMSVIVAVEVEMKNHSLLGVHLNASAKPCIITSVLIQLVFGIIFLTVIVVKRIVKKRRDKRKNSNQWVRVTV